jgi:excisionase family DNA binding protein
MPVNSKRKAGSARRDELARDAHPPTLASLFANVHAIGHPSTTPAASDAVSDDDVIDISGAARMMHIGRNKLYEMVARNQIPHRRFGRRIRFSRAAIMRWLDSWSPRIVKEGQ